MERAYKHSTWSSELITNAVQDLKNVKAKNLRHQCAVAFQLCSLLSHQEQLKRMCVLFLIPPRVPVAAAGELWGEGPRAMSDSGGWGHPELEAAGTSPSGHGDQRRWGLGKGAGKESSLQKILTENERGKEKKK